MFPLNLPQDLMIRYFHLLHGAFTASASVPAIYTQQFWNTLTYDAKTKAYSFQWDETRFTLDANLLRKALEINPIDQAHQFVSPPSGDAIIDFMNKLGYTEVIHFVSRMAAQIPSSLDALGSASPFHLAEEDFKLGNLKFIPKEMVAKLDQKVTAEKKGKKKTAKATKERFSKTLADKPPKPKPAKERLTKTTLPQPTGKDKVIKVHKPKSRFQLVDEPDEEPAHSEPEPKLIHQGKGDKDDMELAIRMSLESFQAQSQVHIGGVAIREPVAESTRPLPVVEGKDKVIATEEQAEQSLLALYVPKKRGTTDQFVLQRQTLVTEEALK
nr:hypothetical protein [Tanacetum cinerariifolium]